MTKKQIKRQKKNVRRINELRRQNSKISKSTNKVMNSNYVEIKETLKSPFDKNIPLEDYDSSIDNDEPEFLTYVDIKEHTYEEIFLGGVKSMMEDNYFRCVVGTRDIKTTNLPSGENISRVVSLSHSDFTEFEERYKRTGETFKTIEYKSRVIYITQWNSKYNCFCVWKHVCKSPMFRMISGRTGSVTHKYGEDSIIFSEYKNGKCEYSVHPLFGDEKFLNPFFPQTT